MSTTTPVVDKMADVLGGDSTDEDNMNNNISENNMNNIMLIDSIKNSNGLYSNNNNNISKVDDYLRPKGTILQEFYNGTNVLITGGTGFLGKMLIHKLLRSCPGVENVYLIVRQKKGKDVHTRVEEIFDDPVFDTLKEEVPKFRHKIVVVAGDVSFIGLGLSPTDKQMLTEKTNIVIHAAATVRFDEKLKLAMAINVHGVKALLDLCRSMKKLKSLIHVSTAYSNCHRDEISECFYKNPCRVEDIDDILMKFDDKTIDDMMPAILGPWPNTYTFTKALAEGYVMENSASLPIGIFRPAIVTSTYREPVVGWIDNLYGPTGVVAGAGTGVLRTLHCNGEVNANIVPVDLCVNALLAAAWDVGNNCNERQEENMLIYNYVSSVDNPITWNDFLKLNVKHGFTYPFASAVWYYCFTLNKNASLNKMYTVLLHYVPAILIDGLALCVGQKPRLLKVYRKVHKFSEVISYFCTHNWNFSNRNVQRLWKKLDDKDKKIFPFDMKTIDWVYYFTYYIRGMSIYLFKEQSDPAYARRKWKRFYVFHIIFKMMMIASFSYVIWSLLSRFVL